MIYSWRLDSLHAAVPAEQELHSECRMHGALRGERLHATLYTVPVKSLDTPSAAMSFYL